MNNFFEELKRYFENKSPKEISENLAKYDVEINNIGPTVEDFLSNCNYYYLQSNIPSLSQHVDFSNSNSSLKFSSGFFFNLTFNRFNF